jgi:hypothetical protein
MKKFITVLFIVSLTLSLSGKVFSQNPNMALSTCNRVWIAANELTFDVYVKNTATRIVAFNGGQYCFNFNYNIRNGGTITCANDTSNGGSQLPTALRPNLVVNSAQLSQNKLYYTANSFGSSPLPIAVGDSVRIMRCRLKTSVSSFAAVIDTIRFRKFGETAPTTKIYEYTPEPNKVNTEITSFVTAYTNMPEEALSVLFANFGANIINKRDVKLNWTTNREVNNAGFDIERKTAEGTWTKIGFVSGNGTTTEQKSYTFEDRKLNVGKYNYRLKQIDNNGNVNYHSLDNAIEVGVPTTYDMSQNYPNPFNPVTKIDYDIPFSSKVNLKIYDMTGREMATLVNEVQTPGYYTVQLDASNLASGTYFYRLIANGNGKDNVFTKKMVVIK